MNKRRLFGVVGNPVLHSKSPMLFNSLFNAQNTNAFYTRMAADSAAEAIRFFKEACFQGMNVTAPFKEEIIQFLDFVEPEAEKLQAVNTVYWNGKRLCGKNTDILGVVNALKEKGVQANNKKCLLIGAGGAGKAAAYGLIKSGAQLTIINRTFAKAEKMACAFGCKAEKIEKLSENIRKNQIIVSTLSADKELISINDINANHVIFDANYKKSYLTKIAEKKQCVLVKGESWLLHQAVPAFEVFLKQKPNIKIMRNALNETLPDKEKLLIGVFSPEEENELKKNRFFCYTSLTNNKQKPDLVLYGKNKSFKQIKQKTDAEIYSSFKN